MNTISIGHFKKINQKNRINIPLEMMNMLGLSESDEVYISCEIGGDCIIIYPKKHIENQIELDRKRRGG